MTIALTEQEHIKLWIESDQKIPPLFDPDAGSGIYTLPQPLGNGYDLYFDKLYPGCELTIFNHQYQENVQVRWEEKSYPQIMFVVLLSGILLQQDGAIADNKHNLILGGGMWRQGADIHLSKQPYLSVWLGLSLEQLIAFFPHQNGELPAALSFLFKPNDWQKPLHFKTNAAIQRVAHQIVTCLYAGVAKRLYLQAKSHDLLALMLAPIVADQGNPKPPAQMKPQTIAQVYAARDLLRLRLEEPLSSLELAQQVGLSDRTLRRGFQKLFGTTVFGYLTRLRMEQAEQLLRGCGVTVAEVANQVGYANPSHFGAAFKRQFGITPQDCLIGKKSVSRG